MARIQINEFWFFDDPEPIPNHKTLLVENCSELTRLVDLPLLSGRFLPSTSAIPIK